MKNLKVLQELRQAEKDRNYPHTYGQRTDNEGSLGKGRPCKVWEYVHKWKRYFFLLATGRGYGFQGKKTPSRPHEPRARQLFNHNRKTH